MPDNLYGVSVPNWSDVKATGQRFKDELQSLHEGASEFASAALNQASQLGREFARDPVGTINATGRSVDNAVRDFGRRVDSNIQYGVNAARDSIEQGVSWTGQQIHAGAELARNQIPTDNIVGQQAHNAITSAENQMRFGVGVIGGVSREAVGLVGAGAQLSSTATQMLLSPTKRQEVTDSIATSVTNGANAAYQYGASVVSNPSRVSGDVSAVYEAGRDAVNGVIDKHQQAIEQGRGPETLGMTTGQVLTYLAPVGGGPARGALTGAVREGGELLAREGTEALARQSATKAGALTDTFHSVVNQSDRRSSADLGVNFFRTSELRRQMAASPIGQKVLGAADAGTIDLQFNAYNLTTSLHGASSGNRALVYLRNTQNGTTYPMLGLKLNGYQHSAAVGVHEGLHALGVAGSRRAEALVRLGELQHLGVPINQTAMRQVLTDMGRNYSHLPWQVGDSTPHFPGLKF